MRSWARGSPFRWLLFWAYSLTRSIPWSISREIHGLNFSWVFSIIISQRESSSSPARWIAVRLDIFIEFVRTSVSKMTKASLKMSNRTSELRWPLSPTKVRGSCELAVELLLKRRSNSLFLHSILICKHRISPLRNQRLFEALPRVLWHETKLFLSRWPSN